MYDLSEEGGLSMTLETRKGYKLRIQNIDIEHTIPNAYMDYEFKTLIELAEFVSGHNKHCMDKCEYRFITNEM